MPTPSPTHPREKSASGLADTTIYCFVVSAVVYSGIPRLGVIRYGWRTARRIGGPRHLLHNAQMDALTEQEGTAVVEADGANALEEQLDHHNSFRFHRRQLS
jgi:hypothetical protein